MAGFLGREVAVNIGPYKAVTTLSQVKRVAGLQSRTKTGTRTEVDVTSDDSGGWREVLHEPGIWNDDLTFSGVMKSGDYHRLMDLFGAGDRNMVASVRYPAPTGFSAGGRAFLQSLETGAEHDGAVTFSATLLFSGKIRRFYGDGYTFISSGALYPLDLFTGAVGDQINEAGDLPTVEPDSMVGATGGGGSLWLVFDDLSNNPPVGKISRMNPADGTITDIPAGNLGTLEPRPRGIAADLSNSPPTHVWVAGESDRLHRVTLSTGNTVASPQTFGITGLFNRPEDLAHANGTLYLLGDTGAGRSLYTLDTATGRATFFMQITSSNADRAFGMDTDGVNLFIGRDDDIVQVDLEAKTLRNIAFENVAGFGNADVETVGRRYLAIV